MPKQYTRELWERAVRLVIEHRGEYETDCAAIRSIAAKLGIPRRDADSPEHGSWKHGGNHLTCRIATTSPDMEVSGTPRTIPGRTRAPAATYRDEISHSGLLLAPTVVTSIRSMLKQL
jgi:hypothetical protein